MKLYNQILWAVFLLSLIGMGTLVAINPELLEDFPVTKGQAEEPLDSHNRRLFVKVFSQRNR